jgi:phosphatidylserine/phosphatidylglycerophosphate/cardiolipin synthase-like enzyme
VAQFKPGWYAVSKDQNGNTQLKYFDTPKHVSAECYTTPKGEQFLVWSVNDKKKEKGESHVWQPGYVYTEPVADPQKDWWDNKAEPAAQTKKATHQGDIKPANTPEKLNTLPDTTANLTTQWFLSESRYPVRPNVDIKLLINGEAAFGAVEDAIVAATKTLDIISWGFDPAMRFKRPGGKRIGQMLAEAGKRGVDVRVLIWKNFFGALKENNIPSQSVNSAFRTEPGTEERFYEKIPIVKSAIELFAPDKLSDSEYRKYWFDKVDNKIFDFSNVEFRTRDFEMSERNKSLPAHAQRAFEESGFSAGSKAAQVLLLAYFPSHHQKCVLVDYELKDPKKSLGFVMGHNMLMNYWDTDDHKTNSDLRDKDMIPWQDLSSRVRGPVLYDLNENFVTAWNQGEPWYKTLTGYDVKSSREAIKPDNFIGPGHTMSAQITRTQPQEKDTSIAKLYMQSVGKGWNYIYFENQYFRFAPLARELVSQAKKTVSEGRKGTLHVFAVTNKPVSGGEAPNTYEMLKVLGKGNTMPEYVRQDNQAAKEQAKVEQDLKDASIKVVLCTLKTTEGEDIYVHAKLLLVDDSFFLLGSANINERSMYVDSELAISTPNFALASKARQDLWKLHTGDNGGVAPCTNESMQATFKTWELLAKKNRINFSSDPRQFLTRHLIDFLYDGKKAVTLD